MTPLPFKRITIFGDSPLLEEYASACLARGAEVSGRLNPDSTSGKIPPGVRKIAKPVRTAALALELTNLSLDQKKRNLQALDSTLGPKIPIFSSSLTVTTAEQSTWMLHPERLVGIGALPSLLAYHLIEFAPSPRTAPAILSMTAGFAAGLGKSAAVVKDGVGLVLPRILCSLMNEACFALTEGVATAGDIDTAMKLGMNYPWGPVQWAEKIGFRHVRAVMEALYGHFGEDRYRISPTLRNAAFQGKITPVP